VCKLLELNPIRNRRIPNGFEKITRRDTILQSVRDKLTQTIWFGTDSWLVFSGRKACQIKSNKPALISNQEERSYMGIAGIELQRY
jgi:hypothetical protein